MYMMYMVYYCEIENDKYRRRMESVFSLFVKKNVYSLIYYTRHMVTQRFHDVANDNNGEGEESYASEEKITNTMT